MELRGPELMRHVGQKIGFGMAGGFGNLTARFISSACLCSVMSLTIPVIAVTIPLSSYGIQAGTVIKLPALGSHLFIKNHALALSNTFLIFSAIGRQLFPGRFPISACDHP